MLRVAVIGCGSSGRRHIGNLLELGCQVFVADTSSGAEDAAIALGAHLYSGAVAHEIQAAVIATPYDTHLKWARVFLGTGVPVFVEKPLGALDQIEDWRALVHQAEGEGVITQIGYQCRFHWAAKALKRLFPTPTEGDFECGIDMRQWPGSSYGPLLLEASHDLDLALWLGMPHVTAAQAGACEYYAWAGNAWRWRLRDFRSAYFRQWCLKQGRHSAEFAFGSPDELGTLMYRDEMLHFVECVREQRQTDVPLSDGLRVLEVCQQIEQMAKAAA